MDPLTAFVSIVGLLGTFTSERRAGQSQTIDEYLEWLRRHNHEELVDLINRNTELLRSLQVLLGHQHSEVIARLTNLQQLVVTVAGRLVDFKPLTDSVGVESRLSDQAVSILRQFNQAKASQVLEFELGHERDLMFLDKDGTIQISEDDDSVRFLPDDLDTLCELGLLRLSYNAKGDRIFTITRAGARIGGGE